MLCERCVAGVQTPAFVERRVKWPRWTCPPIVSPEFRLRPSLSVVTVGAKVDCTRTSAEYLVGEFI